MSGTPALAGENTSREAAAAAVLDAALEAGRKRLAAQVLTGRLLLVLGIALVLPLGAVLADHTLPGGLPRAWLCWVVPTWVGGLAGAALGLVLLCHFRRVSRVFAARCVERGAGIPHNAVVNAVLIRQAAHSAYAAEAAVTQAARALENSPAVALSRPRWPEIALLAAAVAWLVYLVVAPKPVGPSVARLLGADLPPPSASRIELLRPAPGDTVHVGDAVELLFAVHGRRVGEFTLELRDSAGRPTRTFPTSRPVGAAGDRFRFVLAPLDVRGDIHFKCTAGDGRLEGMIPVLPLPEVVSLTIELQPPAYTGWPTERISAPEFEVLAGTQADFRLVANGPVADPIFVYRNDHEQRMRMTVDTQYPEQVSIVIRLVESGHYRFEFADRTGFARRNPPDYRVVVRSDMPPQIDFPDLPPPGDGTVNIATCPTLVAAAADDVRVAELALVLDAGDGQVRTPLTMTPGRDVVARIDLEPLVEPAGEAVRLWVEATDNRVTLDGQPGPQTTRSRVLTVTRSRRDEERGADRTKKNPAPGPSGPAGADGTEETRPDDAGRGDRSDAGGAGPRQASGAESPNAGQREGQTNAGVDSETAGANASRRNPVERPGGGGEQTERGGPNGTPTEQDAAEAVSQFVKRNRERARDAARCCRRSGEGKRSDGERGQPSQGGPDVENGPSRSRPVGSGDRPDDASPEGQGARGETATGPDDRGGAEVAGGTAENQAAPQPTVTSVASPGGESVKGPLEATGVAETMELLERLDRGEDIPEELLVEAGWPVQEAAEFIKALRRLHQSVKESRGTAALRRVFHDARLGSPDVQEGAGISAELKRRVRPGGASQDGLGPIAPPPEQTVPAELNQLLEAYYRAMAGQAGENGR